MVQLVDSDIKTREVLGWKGVHVLHFAGSSCSQKLRIFLNLKNIPWVSHPIDLPGQRKCSRGFSASTRAAWCRSWSMTARCTSRATTLSNTWRKQFPTPKLIPAGHENEVATLLRHEDDLHLDLRTLSFRFVFAPPGPPKPAKALESYIKNGAGTVQGVKDPEKQVQIEFWQRAAKEGFTDERARASAQKFRAEFDGLDGTAGKAALSDGRRALRARYRLVHL